MPNSIIKSRGGRVTVNSYANGVNAGIPDFVFPSVAQDITTESAVYAAFSLGANSGQIAAGAEGVLTPTNCTLREYYAVSNNLGNAVIFAATARRKPGTLANAIGAQTVTFTFNSVEVGRLIVPAAAIGDELNCGYFCYHNSVGDTRVDFAQWPLVITSTAYDADLEIVVWIVGNQD